MEEVIVNIREHSSASAEVMKCALQALRITSVRSSSNGRVCGGNLEDDARFLIGDRRLCRKLVRKRVPPREVDSDLCKS